MKKNRKISIDRLSSNDQCFLDMYFWGFSDSKILKFCKLCTFCAQIPNNTNRKLGADICKFQDLPFGGIYYLYTPNGKLRICSVSSAILEICGKFAMKRPKICRICKTLRKKLQSFSRILRGCGGVPKCNEISENFQFLCIIFGAIHLSPMVVVD